MTRLNRSRLLAAVGSLALLATGACSVHPRVWQNGQAMSSSRAHREMLAGNHSVATQRRLYTSATPLRAWSRDLPYPYFGRW